MYILGINAFHGDASACLLKDGKIVNAIEEERIRRLKHWAGFPSEAINFCLQDAGISIKDIDHIAISRDPSANFIKKISHSVKNMVKISSIYNRLMNSRKIVSVKSLVAKEFHVKENELKATFHNIEHHRAHMASAFFASPFEEAAVLSIDGFGDFSSVMAGTGRANKMEVTGNVIYPHSLGVFYTTFTQYLSFMNYGDEYKMMGLAAYGKPSLVDEVRNVIHLTDDGFFKLNEKYFRHPKEGVKMVWENGVPEIDILYSNYLIEKFGPARQKHEELTDYHKDLAASVQKVCEDVIMHILNHLHKKTGMKNLCIAGGVAQNSVANGKIIQNTPFEELYIPSAGHDAGTSIGAALFVYNQTLGMPRMEPMYFAGLGSKYDNDEIKEFLADKNLNYSYHEDDNLFDMVTDCLINQSGVVGWFQGRAEFGPRALGHRSILVDPRRTDASDLLNLKIKKRESFRPFAPSILKEYVREYFEQADDVPFMEKVFAIKSEKRANIPAVTHVDGTGRLQTVHKEYNEKYHRLISCFHEKTGVPILLNTSFNENEPIVNSPQEALDCFLRTKMDMLVLENFVVYR
ncbi:MAG: carbamoyltransferase [Flavobacteriales bacterium]|nr:MAG: carbamoyltransferase [Flavobacteriales bacterium]